MLKSNVTLVILGTVCLGLWAAVAMIRNRDDHRRAETDLAALWRGDRDAFVKSQRQVCTEHPISLIFRGTGFTDQQIGNYCQCVATMMADATTVEEFAYRIQNGAPSKAFRQKVEAMKSTCERFLTEG
jgi:hypothetical protein